MDNQNTLKITFFEKQIEKYQGIIWDLELDVELFRDMIVKISSKEVLTGEDNTQLEKYSKVVESTQFQINMTMVRIEVYKKKIEDLKVVVSE